MSDLQIGLAVIGAVVIAGVLAYNRVQETRFRKRAETAFAGDQGDVLLETRPESRPERIEPSIKAGAPEPESGAAGRTEPFGLPTRDAADGVAEGTSPIDYTVEVDAEQPLQRPALQQLLEALAGLGRQTVLLSSVADGIWVPVANAAGAITHLRVALQLVDRRGHLVQDDLLAFQHLVTQWAESTDASVRAPEIAPYVRSSRELDQFCNDVDVAIGLNIVAASGEPFTGTKLRSCAEAAGFRLEGGTFRLFDANGLSLFSLEHQQGEPFDPDRLRTAGLDGVTLLLDVPRVSQGVKVFDQMVDVGRQFASALGGALVDDNRAAVTEAGLEQIRNQLRHIYAAMDARGIRAGSGLAMRLFS